MSDLADNITKVRARIQYTASQNARNYENILLLAVSKTRTADEIRAAWQLGLHDFGENYLQEALKKQKLLEDIPICWHFIGQIQSNKTAAIAENFDWVHTIDRFKTARRLSEQRPPGQTPIQACVEINIDNETGKAGIALNEAEALFAELRALHGLQLRGLMVIPDPHHPPDQLQSRFRETREKLQYLQRCFPELQLDTLSMGMSADLEQAIAAGSTIVRVGTDIFGKRPPRRD